MKFVCVHNSNINFVGQYLRGDLCKLTLYLNWSSSNNGLIPVDLNSLFRGCLSETGHRRCCHKCLEAIGSAITNGDNTRGTMCSATMRAGSKCSLLANDLINRKRITDGLTSLIKEMNYLFGIGYREFIDKIKCKNRSLL